MHGVLEEKGVDAEVELVGINTAEEARELRFPGSPTIRVDGEDLFPVPERAEYALGCRIYASPEGLGDRPRPRCFGKLWRRWRVLVPKEAFTGGWLE